MATRTVQLQQPWIDAYSDLQASIHTFSSLMVLSDLNADSDNKLLIVDLGNGATHVKLKVYRGTTLATEIPILDVPSSVQSVYTDTSMPKIPGITVACGSHVLVFRNCRPYFKFSLPPLECSSLETDLWRQKYQTGQLVELLQELSSELGYSNLSAPSQTLLALDPSLREEFAYKHRHCSIKKQTVITCMTTLNKSVAEDKSVGILILATESSQLFILDPEAFTIAEKFLLPGIASVVSASGLYTVDYRVLIVTRTGCLFVMHGEFCRPLIQLSSHAVGLIQINTSFVTANMDNTLQCFTFKGNKQWSVDLPGSPVTLAYVPLSGQALNLIGVSISLESGGCVLLYSGPQLMNSFIVNDVISSLVFGRYGQEEHALISVSNRGGLSVKLLKRTAQFGSGEKPVGQKIQPHNIKLLVPKKSKLFVEQTLREREQCCGMTPRSGTTRWSLLLRQTEQLDPAWYQDMCFHGGMVLGVLVGQSNSTMEIHTLRHIFKDIHGWFQRSWLGLSVSCCEAYLNALRSATLCQREALKLTAQVLGLGPKLKIQLFLENLATDYVPAGLAVTFHYDAKVYTLHKPYIMVPMLVPGLACCLETVVTCELAVVSPIKVFVFASRILLSAVINMPPAVATVGQ